LLRDTDPGYRDERGQLLRPLDGNVLDRHSVNISAQLDLNVEFKGAFTQFGYQGRAEYLRCRRQIESMPVNPAGEPGYWDDTDLGDVVTVPDCAHRPVVR
jgi:hypothetical protein